MSPFVRLAPLRWHHGVGHSAASRVVRARPARRTPLTQPCRSPSRSPSPDLGAVLSRRSLTTALLALTLVTASFPVAHAVDAGTIFFPVQVTEDMTYPDTWGDDRGGHTHTGIDIMSHQMAEVYASASGSIHAYEGDCRAGEQCYSYYLLISGDDGRSYFYVHLNNDTPGRPEGCDGIGGVEAAFSPRLAELWRQDGTLTGVRVERGEHIAYNGSSGNAGCGTDHVHFEIWDGHGWGSPKVDPLPLLEDAHAAGAFWGPEGAPPTPVPTGRVAGEDRVRTAIALSEAAFESSQSVVLAPALVYPEALVAAPLASVMDAPVLITWDQHRDGRDLLDDAVAAEIERLGVTYAVIVGGPDRLGPELEEQLAEKTSIDPSAIRRIQGADRYELSREVAEEVLAARGIPVDPPAEEGGTDGQPSVLDLPPTMQDATTTGEGGDDPEDGDPEGEAASEEPPIISPILALGEHEIDDRGWPDALSASVLAARQQVPVLLTAPGELPQATRDILDNEHVGEVRIAGGPAAVSDEVEAMIQEEHGKATRRMAGATRYSTSQAIAAEYAQAEGVGLERVFIATGRNFPDALAAGSSLARLDRVLVLVDGESTSGSPSTYGWLRDRAGAIEAIVSIGGPAAVTVAVLEQVARYANWSR